MAQLWFCVKDLGSLEKRVIAPAPDKGVWRLGIPGSGVAIELAEPSLAGLDLFVWGASNHLLLRGQVSEGAALPALGIWLARNGEWDWRDPLEHSYTLEEGRLAVRFDYRWLRIGAHALRAGWDRTDFDEKPVVQQPPTRSKPWWRLFSSALANPQHVAKCAGGRARDPEPGRLLT